MTDQAVDREMIPVDVAHKKVYTYNQEGKKSLLGEVVSRVFEGENAQRHFFVSKGSDSEYSLGATTDTFKFLDHAQVMKPLLDEGYQIRSLKVMRGGLKLWALMTPGKPEKLPDPINWDQDFWDHKGGNEIMQAVAISSSIAPGHGIRYQMGWFRQVCTNGLIADILGMGSGKFSHITWNKNGVSQFLSDLGDGGVNPIVGSKAGVEQVYELVQQLPSISNEDTVLSVPYPVRSTLKPLMKLPSWYQSDLAEQLRLFSENGPKEVTALDVLNMITSPLNYREQQLEESRERYFLSTGRLVSPLNQLIGFLSLASGSKTPIDSASIVIPGKPMKEETPEESEEVIEEAEETPEEPEEDIQPDFDPIAEIDE